MQNQNAIGGLSSKQSLLKSDFKYDISAFRSILQKVDLGLADFKSSTLDRLAGLESFAPNFTRNLTVLSMSQKKIEQKMEKMENEKSEVTNLQIKNVHKELNVFQARVQNTWLAYFELTNHNTGMCNVTLKVLL